MKKIVFTTLLSTLLLTSCADDKKHIEAAENFTKSFFSGKIDEATKFMSESTATKLEAAMASSKQSFVKPNFEFSFVKDSVNKNESWVRFKNLEDNKIETLYLIKVDNNWLVHFDPKKQNALAK